MVVRDCHGRSKIDTCSFVGGIAWKLSVITSKMRAHLQMYLYIEIKVKVLMLKTMRKCNIKDLGLRFIERDNIDVANYRDCLSLFSIFFHYFHKISSSY